MTAAPHQQIAELRKALEQIAKHKFNSYETLEGKPAYAGSYGIGVVDGHRACTIIAKAALSSSPASDLVAGALAHLFAQYIIEQHENLEDRAPVDVFCGECNLDTGPHRATCVPHQAKALLAKP